MLSPLSTFHHQFSQEIDVVFLPLHQPVPYLSIIISLYLIGNKASLTTTIPNVCVSLDQDAANSSFESIPKPYAEPPLNCKLFSVYPSYFNLPPKSMISRQKDLNPCEMN